MRGESDEILVLDLNFVPEELNGDRSCGYCTRKKEKERGKSEEERGNTEKERGKSKIQKNRSRTVMLQPSNLVEIVRTNGGGEREEPKEERTAMPQTCCAIKLARSVEKRVRQRTKSGGGGERGERKDAEKKECMSRRQRRERGDRLRYKKIREINSWELITTAKIVNM